MKQHVDARSSQWKDSVHDRDLLLAAGVPLTIATKAVSLDPRPLPKSAKYWVDSLDFVHKPSMEAVNENPDLIGTGLCLYGPSGKGKTVLATHILLAILRSDRLHWVDDSPRSQLMFSILGRFFDWQELSALLRASNAPEPPPEWETMSAVLNGAPIAGEDPYYGPYFGGGVVVIDDISRERQTEYNQDRLHSILRRRNNDALITILTTNFAPDEWDAVYGPVLSAFMKRTFIVGEIK